MDSPTFPTNIPKSQLPEVPRNGTPVLHRTVQQTPQSSKLGLAGLLQSPIKPGRKAFVDLSPQSPMDERGLNITDEDETLSNDQCCCPITNRLMKKPVRINCGHVFEKWALREQIKEGNSQCSICKKNITSFEVDYFLQAKIRKWKEKNKILKKMEESEKTLALHQRIEQLEQQIAEFSQDSTEEILPNVPVMFLCPITKEIMQDPVMIDCGDTFERSAILNYTEDNCPKCGTALDLDSNTWTPNEPIKAKIKDWLLKNRPISPETEVLLLKEQIEALKEEFWDFQENIVSCLEEQEQLLKQTLHSFSTLTKSLQSYAGVEKQTREETWTYVSTPTSTPRTAETISPSTTSNLRAKLQALKINQSPKKSPPNEPDMTLISTKRRQKPKQTPLNIPLSS